MLRNRPQGPSAEERRKHLNECLFLAKLYGAAVEGFIRYHGQPKLESHRIAITRLGIEQGRLLMWGDAVGITSPPENVTTRQIPSHPQSPNPEPKKPINFIPRDPRLDDPELRPTIEACLLAILNAPMRMGQIELLRKYGLRRKRPCSRRKPETTVDIPRLGSFREKFALLRDVTLLNGLDCQPMAFYAKDLVIKNLPGFSQFVDVIKTNVDELIRLFDVQRQIDGGVKTDIRTLGWHTNLQDGFVERDKTTLRRIRAGCVEDYPEYARAAAMAIAYIEKYVPDENEPDNLERYKASAYDPDEFWQSISSSRNPSARNSSLQNPFSRQSSRRLSSRNPSSQKTPSRRPSSQKPFSQKTSPRRPSALLSHSQQANKPCGTPAGCPPHDGGNSPPTSRRTTIANFFTVRRICGRRKRSEVKEPSEEPKPRPRPRSHDGCRPSDASWIPPEKWGRLRSLSARPSQAPSLVTFLDGLGEAHPGAPVVVDEEGDAALNPQAREGAVPGL